MPIESHRSTAAHSAATRRFGGSTRTAVARRGSLSDVGRAWGIALGLTALATLVGCASESTTATARPGTEAAIPASIPANPSADQPQAASTPRPGTATDSFGEMPDDLTVDVTILPGTQMRGRSEAHLARSKYIVFPDGSMHGDRGRTIEVRTRPGRIRTLSRESMADLWLLLGQSGFSDLRETGFGGNPELLAPAPAEVLTILTVHARGVTGTFIRRTPADAPDPAMTRVVRSIARLAWATDDPPLETTIQPVRYDLGPDPYARYRNAPAVPVPPTSQATSPAPSR